jgi:hypothetical protein
MCPRTGRSNVSIFKNQILKSKRNQEDSNIDLPEFVEELIGLFIERVKFGQLDWVTTSAAVKSDKSQDDQTYYERNQQAVENAVSCRRYHQRTCSVLCFHFLALRTILVGLGAGGHFLDGIKLKSSCKMSFGQVLQLSALVVIATFTVQSIKYDDWWIWYVMLIAPDSAFYFVQRKFVCGQHFISKQRSTDPNYISRAWSTKAER